MNKKFIVSCTYDYLDIAKKKDKKLFHTLIVINSKKKYFLKYPAIITSDDFLKHAKIIIGQLPNKNVYKYKKLTKLGFRGLQIHKDHIYAATYNSIYKINKIL